MIDELEEIDPIKEQRQAMKITKLQNIKEKQKTVLDNVKVAFPDLHLE